MSLLYKKPLSGQTESIERRHTREPLADSAKAPSRFAALKAAALFSPASGRVKIGFVGLAAGAGATTLCFAAAEYLAALSSGRGGSKPFTHKTGRTVTVLELDLKPFAPAGSPYDKIGVDRRFAGRDFVSIYRLAAEGKPLHGACNIDGGVSWALRVPGESVPPPDHATLHRLVGNVFGDIVLCDISATAILAGGGHAANRAALTALLADLDHIVCIFDPLPSRLLASVPAAEACRAAAASGVPVTCVFNKFNPGVNMREALRFTGVKDYLPFPAVPAEAVYAAEFACRSLSPELASPLSALFLA